MKKVLAIVAMLMMGASGMAQANEEDDAIKSGLHHPAVDFAVAPDSNQMLVVLKEAKGVKDAMDVAGSFCSDLASYREKPTFIGAQGVIPSFGNITIHYRQTCVGMFDAFYATIKRATTTKVEGVPSQGVVVILTNMSDKTIKAFQGE